MAKLIFTSQYKGKGEREAIKGLITYIGTRENVEILPQDQTKIPASKAQERYIKMVLKEIPELKNTLEYEDYKNNPNYDNAMEVLNAAVELGMSVYEDKKNLIEYIGRRKGAEKFGTHGLFTESGVPHDITKTAEMIADHNSRLYTNIISLRREDAARLGYDNAKNWMDLIAANAKIIAEGHKIPIENLRYAAAFHDEGHHPHVHMYVYSAKPSEGYLNEEGIDRMRRAFADDIFRQDMMHTYEEKTVIRDELRKQGREKVRKIVESINNRTYDNPEIQKLLIELSEKLKKRKGRKVYASIGNELREVVDKIVDEFEKDKDIKELYSSWYDQQEEVLKLYRNKMPERKPLFMQEEFKPIKNAIIAEALKINEFPTETIMSYGLA